MENKILEVAERIENHLKEENKILKSIDDKTDAVIEGQEKMSCDITEIKEIIDRF